MQVSPSILAIVVFLEKLVTNKAFIRTVAHVSTTRLSL